MNKQKVKVILKVAEELWASKSSGYKKVRLGTKKPVSLLLFYKYTCSKDEHQSCLYYPHDVPYLHLDLIKSRRLLQNLQKDQPYRQAMIELMDMT